MKNALLLSGLGALVVLSTGIAAAESKPASGKSSRTCKFNKGSKAGEVQYFADATPVPLGDACGDGFGSSGVAVADVRVKAVATASAHTCKFTSGPRAGQKQYFPDASPLAVGDVCEDVDGSSGVAVADSKRPVARGGVVKTSRTCKFNHGSKAGYSQFFAAAPPVELGAPCDDAAGSTGVAVADSPSGSATARTCKFTTGSRKGTTQYYPDVEPIQLGGTCEDGGGSTGVIVPDGKQAKKKA